VPNDIGDDTDTLHPGNEEGAPEPVLVSISSTFYVQLLRSQIPKAEKNTVKS